MAELPWVIVLAAGGSRRFGAPKQLYVWEGESLLRRVVRVALAVLPEVVVVLGAAAAACEVQLENQPVRICENHSWAEGIASSIRTGVQIARNGGAQAVLFLTVDQVRLTTAVLARFLERYEGQPDEVIAAFYQGVPGIPLLFGRHWFDGLEMLTGDKGAKRLIRGYPATKLIDWADGAFDLDTPPHRPGNHLGLAAEPVNAPDFLH